MRRLNVLIVEDNRTNLMLMAKLVERVEGCASIGRSDPVELLGELADIDFDLAVVDFRMPGLDGVDLIRAMHAHPRHADKPVVMVTADGEAELRLAALEAGAMEFLHKPIDPVEFMTRVRNIARLCEAQRKLADQAEWLRDEVEAATLELRRREEEIVQRLSLAAGYKDEETGEHTRRMARLCGAIARELGLPPDQCRDIELAAPMHDIGKVGIRDGVLLKRGPLEPDEMAHMREHARIGAEILSGSACELLTLAADMAASHHERWDGSGYPAGLSGEAIPLVGRIAAVADVYDALTTERPYKPAWSREAAVALIDGQSGRHFDPACVAAFMRFINAGGTGAPPPA